MPKSGGGEQPRSRNEDGQMRKKRSDAGMRQQLVNFTRPLRRQACEYDLQICGSSARMDLCGGWQVTAIPTATGSAPSSTVTPFVFGSPEMSAISNSKRS